MAYPGVDRSPYPGDVTDPAGDPIQQAIDETDARLGSLIAQVIAIPDRSRGARLIRAAIDMLQHRSKDAGAARREIIDRAALEDDLDGDALAVIAGPDGKPVTRARVSQLRKEARERRAADADREVQA